jgi:plastocyanin
LSTRRFAISAACVALCAVGATSAPVSAQDPTPLDPIIHRGDRYIPKPAGTREKLHFWFGPYVVPAGHDLNRVDVDLPLANGMITQIAPGVRMADTLQEPSHQLMHIHHAHWFAVAPGNKEDNYFGGNTEWIFGNGDEETEANFEERSAADPNGPIYGQFIGASGPQAMIYMLHNKTSVTKVVYIDLSVTFVHGTVEELNALGGRPYHDLHGVLFGRTYDVPRQFVGGDGIWETPKDDPHGVIQWTSTLDGTIIGTGGHVHPGGLRVMVENYGTKEHPCPDDHQGYGGTLLLRSESIQRHAPFSEDFQMSVTHPRWRAPIHKGDRIRIAGVYENRDHAWYDVMTHEGFYIDTAQKPAADCTPWIIGQPKTRPVAVKVKKKAKKKATHKSRKNSKSKKKAKAKSKARKKVTAQSISWIEPTQGVLNRSWGAELDQWCGADFGRGPCETPMAPPGKGVATTRVDIVNFIYTPGDRSLAGAQGQPVQVKKGTSLTFVNEDSVLDIRHSVTTCAWPCNGRYVANYPLADGYWDSGVLSPGIDVVDGEHAKMQASTPTNLPVGTYAYFCRIHPWMRGAFQIVP